MESEKALPLCDDVDGAVPNVVHDGVISQSTAIQLIPSSKREGVQETAPSEQALQIVNNVVLVAETVHDQNMGLSVEVSDGANALISEEPSRDITVPADLSSSYAETFNANDLEEGSMSDLVLADKLQSELMVNDSDSLPLADLIPDVLPGEHLTSEFVEPAATSAPNMVECRTKDVDSEEPIGTTFIENVKTSLNYLHSEVTAPKSSEDMEELQQWASQPAAVLDGFDPFRLSFSTGDSSSSTANQDRGPEPLGLLASTPPTPKSRAHTECPVHQLKWITFNGKRVPIITQSENGPCPMIAIMNVLLLQRKIVIPENLEVISGDRIIATLSDKLLSLTPSQFPDEGDRSNYEGNLSDALGIFPSLQTGLDINVRFIGVSQFEYTPALTVFDLFGIPLVHGWVFDPQDRHIADALRDQTYNQVVEMIIDCKSSSDAEKNQVGLLAEDFLARTASQLTIYGLCELSASLHEGQLAILFRNNHFNTIYKKADHIFVLVTDAGFNSEPKYVWETFNDVEGDSLFCDADFRLCTQTSPVNQTISSPASPAVATAAAEAETPMATTTTPLPHHPSAPPRSESPAQIDLEAGIRLAQSDDLLEPSLSDFELAQHLQLQEAHEYAVALAAEERQLAQTAADRELAERLQAEELSAAASAAASPAAIAAASPALGRPSPALQRPHTAATEPARSRIDPNRAPPPVPIAGSQRNRDKERCSIL